MRCLFCGSENKDTAKFCVRCGKKVPRCPTCGNVILSRARFCKYDGTRLPEEILSCFPEPEAPKESVFVPPVVPVVVPEEPVAEPESVVEPEPIVIPVPVEEPVVEPEPIVIPVPVEEPIVEPEPIVIPVPVEEPVSEPEPVVIPVPVAEPEELPVSYCVKCGAVCTDGMKLCPKCRQEAAPRPAAQENFCVRCGAPCEPNQKLCPDCREREAAGKRNKRMSRLVIVLLVLLLITATVAGALIWRELSRGGDRDAELSVQTTQAGDEDPREETTEAPTTVPTEAPTTAPTTVPTTAPTEPPVVTYVSEYEVIAADVSWQEARQACEARGGSLVVITSEEEYNRVCAYANQSGLSYIWLGGCISSAGEEWGNGSWITGEDWTYARWYPGEPSKQDEDGTQEFYLCMWNAKFNKEEIGWTFNDQRNDIVADFPKVSGKIGYICEYKVEVVQ